MTHRVEQGAGPSGASAFSASSLSVHPPAGAPAVREIPRAREVLGEQSIARVLRMGALLAGLFFVASLAVELWPPWESQASAVDVLRKAGMALLVATPVCRLVAVGIALGSRGEWRYAAYAVGVLLLLALAVAAGVGA